jgi:hypothetical protein
MSRAIPSLVVFVLTSLCFAGDPVDLKAPPTIDAMYYARADFRFFRGYVQVNDPHDIARRQSDEKLLIEAEASYLFQIIDEPQVIPEKSREAISRALSTESPEARKQILEGPILGPMAAFVLFDRNRKPTALVTQLFGVYVTSHLQTVSGDDIFQRVGEWRVYSHCADLTELVGVAKSYAPERETPFMIWQKIAVK